MFLIFYVNSQQERQVRDNKPAIAPNGRVLTVIQKRGIDLKREFNIDPPGWKAAQIRDRDAEMDAMRKQIEELTSLLTSGSSKGKKD